MHEDEERVRIKPSTQQLGQALETASVTELEAYVAALQAEIARVRDEIAKRSDHRAAAEALFRRPGGDDA